MRDAQLSQLRAKEVEAAEKVRAANERVVASLEAEREALAQTERERFVAQALSRLSAEATAQQRREVEQLAGALYDEQQALQARQRLMDEGRSVIDRTRTATEQHAAEIAKLNELLEAGAIDQATYARAVEDANDRALRSSQAWTDGATRFLKDYVAESNDAATATERAFANAFGGAEDALVGFITSGKLEFQGLADSILADLARMTVRQTHHGPARRCSAERVRRRRAVRPVPRGRHRRRAAAGGALCRCRGVRARAALPRWRLRRLRPAAGRGPDHRAAWGAGGAARAGRARGEVGTRAAADHRGGQRHRRRRELLPCEPGPDRGRHGARDRSGEPEPMTIGQADQGRTRRHQRGLTSALEAGSVSGFGPGKEAKETGNQPAQPIRHLNSRHTVTGQTLPARDQVTVQFAHSAYRLAERFERAVPVWPTSRLPP